MEEDKEEENVQAPEPEPEPESEPQGLADEGERSRIVEDMEKEDQNAQIIEQCGDSSDDERFPVLGEWQLPTCNVSLPPSSHVSPFSLYGCCLLQM